MWINNGNVPDHDGSTHVHRVTMDGMTDTDFSTPFANHEPPVTPLPDGSVAFYATRLERLRRHQDLPGQRHPHHRRDDGGQREDRARWDRPVPPQQHRVLAVGRHAGLLRPRQRLPHQGRPKTGTTVWVLNGSTGGITSTFTGDLWSGGEHGFHLISADRLPPLQQQRQREQLTGARADAGHVRQEVDEEVVVHTEPRHQGSGAGRRAAHDHRRSVRRREREHHRRLRDGRQDSRGRRERHLAPGDQEPRIRSDSWRSAPRFTDRRPGSDAVECACHFPSFPRSSDEPSPIVPVRRRCLFAADRLCLREQRRQSAPQSVTCTDGTIDRQRSERLQLHQLAHAPSGESQADVGPDVQLGWSDQGFPRSARQPRDGSERDLPLVGRPACRHVRAPAEQRHVRDVIDRDPGASSQLSADRRRDDAEPLQQLRGRLHRRRGDGRDVPRRGHVHPFELHVRVAAQTGTSMSAPGSGCCSRSSSTLHRPTRRSR